jgi:hypothetical protein
MTSEGHKLQTKPFVPVAAANYLSALLKGDSKDGQGLLQNLDTCNASIENMTRALSATEKKTSNLQSNRARSSQLHVLSDIQGMKNSLENQIGSISAYQSPEDVVCIRYE